MIRPVRPEDAAALTEIYNYYILNTVITFEEEPVTTEIMEQRIAKVTETYPWIVYEENESVSGYAYLGNFHTRSAYRYTGEVTIYLRNGLTGNGTGTELFRTLINEAVKTDLHSLISIIALPNDRSTGIHEKFGFRKTAHLTEAGWKFGKWIDVGYWELMLDDLR